MKKCSLILIILALIVGVFACASQPCTNQNVIFAQEENGTTQEDASGSTGTQNTTIDVTVVLDYTNFNKTEAGCTFEEYCQSVFQQKNGDAWETKTGFTIKGSTVELTIKMTSSKDTFNDAFSRLTGYVPSGHSLEIQDGSKVVTTTDNKITVVIKESKRMDLEDTKSKNWWGIIQLLLDWFDAVFVPILIIVGTAGMFYAIYLGISLAKAESEDKRAEAKKRMLWFILAFVLTILLLIVLKLIINNVGAIEDLIFDLK